MSTTREELIAGLRAVADFYEANPTMPVPAYPDLCVHTRGDNDEAEVEQVRAAAEVLGVEMKVGAHVTADRAFGKVSVRVVHVPSPVMANHVAHMSYADNIKAADGAS